MIRNILFDWSGTLVDDLPAVWKATNEVFRSAGLEPLTLDRFRAEFCLPFKNFYDRFTPHVAMHQLEEWFHAHFRVVQDSVIELPYGREFLEQCRQRGIRTYVLSTIHPDHYKVQCQALGLGGMFDHAYVGVWDKAARIREILEEREMNSEETLFIGDMQHDMETAKVGGIFSCGVLTGYNSLEQLRVSEPDLIVEHLGELRHLLDKNDWAWPAKGKGTALQHAEHPIVTVGAAIFDQHGKVLMLRTHKWSNLWGIPGGKIKRGETAVDALLREVKEETGLDAGDVEFVLVQDSIDSPEFYRPAHFVLLNYRCRCDSGELVALNDEAQEARWVSMPEAMSMPLNAPTRVLLERIQQEQAL